MIHIELIRGPRNAVVVATAWLDAMLAPGEEIRAATIIRLAKEAGISRASLLRSKACQRVRSTKTRGRQWGPWTWRRPTVLDESDG